VTGVEPGGGFDRAGIQVGDVFFSYHGYPAAAFYSTLGGGRGGKVTLDLKRPPDWDPVTVTLEVPK
jgi:S1-C subfamily serine protease